MAAKWGEATAREEKDKPTSEVLGGICYSEEEEEEDEAKQVSR